MLNFSMNIFCKTHGQIKIRTCSDPEVSSSRTTHVYEKSDSSLENQKILILLLLYQ